MDQKEYKLLVEGWKRYITFRIDESLNLSDLNYLESLIEKLNQLSLDGMREYEDKEDYFSRFINLIKSEPGLKLLGRSGSDRDAFSMKGVNWVIKVANSRLGDVVNNQEIEISKKRHGSGIQDTFINIFYKDEINVKPVWYVCEKVVPLNYMIVNGNLEDLKKIFPTFWNILLPEYEGIKNPKMSESYNFVYWVTELLMYWIKICREDFKKRKLNLHDFNKEKFYEAADFLGRVKNPNDFEWGEDFFRLKRSLNYVNSKDLHVENVGLRINSSPSPSDIVFLDFDLKW